ncbi:MAG: hypothetical protein I8H86_04020 [Sphingomonadaceae bacterium]|nr:hypothetical protein [Sphingomonadaceae bacterium]
MTSSLTLISAYAVLLVTILLTPYTSLCFGPRQERYWRPAWHGLCALLLIGAIILTIARDINVLLICALVVLPFAGLGMGTLLGATTAALLFMTVIWWSTDFPLSEGAFRVFIPLAFIAGLLPRWGKASLTELRGHRLLWPMLLSALIGLLAGLLTAPFEAMDPIHAAWHHWTAYLSPVEAWRGGGAPYRDFPIQYGLGPTALLMAACGNDCWRGIYMTSITANALYFATLVGCVIILTAQSTRGLRWLALAAMFCASFIWTGYPVQFVGPAMTPSVAGLRFLSISALLFHILLAEQWKTPRDWIGHMIWLFSLFWSFEAGIFGTLIWWPYLALRNAGSAEGSRRAVIALIIGAIRGIFAVMIGVSALVLALWLLSERSITATDFFAYIQHPPGTRSINPVGALWIALLSIALALPLLARRGLSPQARPFYMCLVGFVVSGTYYISRSHDNNILNLFPLLVLLLLAIFANRENPEKARPGFAGAFVQVMLASMVAFVATFNFAPWREGVERAGPLTFGPARLLSRISLDRDAGPPAIPPDGVAGMEYLRAHHGGMVVLFDKWNVMPRSSGGTAWTGVNSIANYANLPHAMVLDYIRRGATAYDRPGWILVDIPHRQWVEDFKTAYDIGEQRSFGTYTAYYMVPRHPEK